MISSGLISVFSAILKIFNASSLDIVFLAMGLLCATFSKYSLNGFGNACPPPPPL